MTLSLISRYNSENSEFFRNVGKSFLITDQKTYDIKQAIQFQINQLAHSLQKSSIWPFIEQPIPENEIIELLQNLKKFKNLFMFEQEIDKNDKNDFKSVNSSKKRKVLKVYQNIFRCLKGYDIILNFIQHNKKVFQEIQKKLNSIKTNWDYSQELNDNKINNYKVIQKVFKYCFQILEGFTRHNSKNQSLMWKYKEFLVFHKLQGIEQIGELNFLKQILNNNKKIKLARNLENFVSLLNQRIGHELQNISVILGIYSNIIPYHDIPYVKKAVFSSLESNLSLRKLNERQDQNTFETGIIILEILSFILQGDETGNSREILKKYFNLEQMINQSLDFLNNISNIYFSLQQMIEYKNGTLNMMQTYLDEGRYNQNPKTPQ